MNYEHVSALTGSRGLVNVRIKMNPVGLSKAHMDDCLRQTFSQRLDSL